VSEEATDWGGPSDETGKTEVPCHSRCSSIKIPPSSRALCAEYRPKFCCPSPVMQEILQQDVILTEKINLNGLWPTFFFLVMKIIRDFLSLGNTIGIYLSVSKKHIWLIINWLTSISRIFHIFGDIAIASEGLQNLGPCSLSREGSLSFHTCCDTGPRFFPSHPHSASYDTPRGVSTYTFGYRRTAAQDFQNTPIHMHVFNILNPYPFIYPDPVIYFLTV
jgi:hypothetical protein